MADALGRGARFAGRTFAASLCLLVAGACGTTDVTMPDGADAARLALSDGAHGDGNEDFFFLPPMVPDPSGHPSFDPGAFDGTLSPRVEICQVEEDDCADAQPAGFPIVFDMTSGHGSTRLRVSEDDEHYIVNWHTRRHALDPSVTYRIGVWVEAELLGFADVDVVEGGSELSGVDEESYVAVKNGRTLPIEFRIEDGALAPPSADIVVDGSGRRFGPLPAVVYALAENVDGEDLYPLGEGAFYLFGLYDTGSTRVRLFNEIPYFFTAFPDPNGGLVRNVPNRLTDGNFFDGDASLFGITDEVTARVRLNGLSAVDPATLAAPIGQGLAQVEVTDVAVRPQPTDPVPLDVTLIGGSVNQHIVASIDYTTRVVRSGYDFYPGLADPTPAGTGIPDFSAVDAVAGPDITFFAPADPDVPSLPLELPLTRIGTPAVRYGLLGVEMVEGANTYGQDPSASPPEHVLFDTGTTITIIGDAVAGALALAPGAGTFDCLGGSSNGYEIDAVRLGAPGGTYTVTDASVCWRQEVLPLFLTAITGSNLFDQVPTVFDGAGDRLWVGEPTPSPVAW